MEDSRHRFDAVEALLRERIGLNLDSLGRKHVCAAAQRHMTECGAIDCTAYLAKLQANDEEFQQLVEKLVVSESWFFRDLKPFQFLEQCLADRLRALALERPLRLLSVPCGTGEEPFSMALTLLNKGIEPARFHVDAIDISQHALATAEKGSFGKSSFREQEEVVAGFRERYFRRDGQRWTIHPEVRKSVRFRRANLVEAGFLRGEAPYDVIFCRNLLIYLDDVGRRAALTNLHRLLEPEGALYVGHVEAASLRGFSFAPYSSTYPFAFRPLHGSDAATKNDQPATKRHAFKPRPQLRWKSDTVPVTTKTPAAIKTPREASVPDVDAEAELAAARQSADAGRLVEAAAKCVELLAKQPPSAAVYCLLGVIRRAQGEAAEAEKCFQKAVYLDPRQHEALVHLELLARQRGDEAGAKIYHRRAEKIRGNA